MQISRKKKRNLRLPFAFFIYFLYLCKLKRVLGIRLCKPTKFTGDYTQIPRGRVAWNIDKFIVLVGKWAEENQEELTALINRYFALPYFEFVYDEHWDLGHGWSGDI